MLIAQITDLHIGFESDAPDEPNRRRLEQALATLMAGPNRPDVLLITGDMTDRGDVASYAWLRETFARLPVPVYPMVGNHDDRGRFGDAFPQAMNEDGFAQYVVTLGGLRLIVLDTLATGRHGGGFCRARADWLTARLDEAPDTPTVLVMHHPPFVSGIAWMDPAPSDPWIGRFAAAVAGRPQILAIWCGHLHRAIAATWHGATITVCPSISAELTLDLRPIDTDRPDDRAMVCNGPPGAALHRWTDGTLVTMFETFEPRTVLARFDARMQPVVRHLAAERASDGAGR